MCEIMYCDWLYFDGH